jgi:8-oxo-dGTP diphosphatase
MEQEKTLYEAVVCFFIRNGQVLLARKMKKIGKGKWNGYGGGIESGEDEKQACTREVKEETGGVIIVEKDLEKVADTYFHNTKEDGSKFICHVAVFLVSRWQGQIINTDEMTEPTWFDFAKIPVAEMLPADAIWLPIVFSGKKIIVKASYGPHQANLIDEVKIDYVESL